MPKYHGLEEREWKAFFKSDQWIALRSILGEKRTEIIEKALALKIDFNDFLRFSGAKSIIDKMLELDDEVAQEFEQMEKDEERSGEDA